MTHSCKILTLSSTASYFPPCVPFCGDISKLIIQYHRGHAVDTARSASHFDGTPSMPNKTSGLETTSDRGSIPVYHVLLRYLAPLRPHLRSIHPRLLGSFTSAGSVVFLYLWLEA
ncbi:hypothetical protein BC938DRAFT_478102 [Jimgerdemannia flammicorona]|uniref:Uncharacterized protein n=1 Tax=Jimgerdemannia flammicorona TaxID=994334 RepID=A0A433QND0_9FUNG|nr:hypothetical protein BC938DRAFT_478102 [Jimgerdemannia flammicorona]